MILSDLEWLSEIFNDTKRRAVSLRQLSFLLVNVVNWWIRSYWLQGCGFFWDKLYFRLGLWQAASVLSRPVKDEAACCRPCLRPVQVFNQIYWWKEQCVPKNEISIILNILYSCKSIAMIFSTWYPDFVIDWLALAIKRIPHHYRTLHKNRFMALTSWIRGG